MNKNTIRVSEELSVGVWRGLLLVYEDGKETLTVTPAEIDSFIEACTRLRDRIKRREASNAGS